MLIYSKKIALFLLEVEALLKYILSEELELEVHKNHFYRSGWEQSYPIAIVVYDDKSPLGVFDAAFYELGFHKCLLHAKKEQLENVLRHVVKEYMTFLGDSYGLTCTSFAHRMRQSEAIKPTDLYPDGDLSPSNAEHQALLRKVQKLMALGASKNSNEAEQAMMKSQQLLLKYNLQMDTIDDEEDQQFVLKRIIKQTKMDAKVRAISRILETFLVSSVFNRLRGFTYLEIIGTAVNIEIAEYVAKVLQRKLDELWEETKKKRPDLKGMVAKNSFFLGLAEGYCSKINLLEKTYSSNTSRALAVIHKKLDSALEMAYGNLTANRSCGRQCQESLKLGNLAGKDLTIHPSIKKPTKGRPAYLDFDPS